MRPRTLLLAALALGGCRDPAPPPMPARAVPPPARAVPPPDDAGAPAIPAPTQDDAAASELSRFFPGADSARRPRVHRSTVVLLFAPPGHLPAPYTLSSLPRLRFVPVVCVITGKLASGARCGEAMPARAQVRLTDSGAELGLEEIELTRSAARVQDRQGGHSYPPPYGPACCMYNTCVGRTVPYYASERDPDFVLTTTRTVLAVWPADAEIDLSILGPGANGARDGGGGGGGDGDADTNLAELQARSGTPWAASPAAGTPAAMQSRLIQSARVHDRTYVSVSLGGMGAKLYLDKGGSWQELLAQPGVRDYYVLSASDLDSDGRPELMVYARWANDYGLHLIAGDNARPLYEYSCGNI